MSEFIWFIGIGATVFATFILGVTLFKLSQVRRAKSWPATGGKVVLSKVESRERGGVHSADAERTGNYPHVVYEYEVSGERYTGKRVSLGEEMPGVEVESTLARFPVGAEVQVYYDPKNPAESVLERDLPAGFGKVVGCIVVFIVVAAVVTILVITEAASKLKQRVEFSGDSKLGWLLAGMGLFAAMIALMQRRQLSRAKRWPSVRGEVRTSHIERYLSSSSGSRSSTGVLFRPRVIYAYTVDGREYSNDRIALGSTGGSSEAGFLRKRMRDGSAANHLEIVDKAHGRGGGVPTAGVERVVRRYPTGTAVDVYYDPKSPSESVLERRLAGAWLVWLIAAGLLVGSICAFHGD